MWGGEGEESALCIERGVGKGIMKVGRKDQRNGRKKRQRVIKYLGKKEKEMVNDRWGQAGRAKKGG